MCVKGKNSYASVSKTEQKKKNKSKWLTAFLVWLHVWIRYEVLRKEKKNVRIRTKIFFDQTQTWKKVTSVILCLGVVVWKRIQNVDVACGDGKDWTDPSAVIVNKWLYFRITIQSSATTCDQTCFFWIVVCEVWISP